MKRITDRQLSLLAFIQSFTGKEGLPPTIREMGAGLGISFACAYQQKVALCRKGYLNQPPPGRDRALTLTTKGFSALGIRGPESVPFYPSYFSAYHKTGDTGAVRVPSPGCWGDQISLLFSVPLEGEAMTGAGLRAGDTLIFLRTGIAYPGDIILGWTDGAMATRFLANSERGIVLQAHNPLYPDIPCPDLRVLGRLRGMVRVVEDGL